MPLKTIIKIIWSANFIVLLSVMIVGGWLLFNPPAPPQIKDFGDPPTPEPQEQRTMHYYQDIWMTDVLKKKVQIAPIIGTPSNDMYRNVINRNVKIEQILSPGFAMLKIKEKDAQLYTAKPTDAQNNPKNTAGGIKPWQIQVEAHTVSIIEITPGKGIRFRFDSMGIEVFVEHKSGVPATSPPSSSSSNSSSSSGLGKKTDENHWTMTSQEGTQLLQNYDRHIEQIGPKVEYDENGQAIGVKLQGVPPDSEAYRFGLRQNDVVRSVNGTTLNSTDPDFVKRLISTHRRSNRITVEVIRNGRVEQIMFDINRGQ